MTILYFLASPRSCGGAPRTSASGRVTHKVTCAGRCKCRRNPSIAPTRCAARSLSCSAKRCARRPRLRPRRRRLRARVPWTATSSAAQRGRCCTPRPLTSPRRRAPRIGPARRTSAAVAAVTSRSFNGIAAGKGRAAARRLRERRGSGGSPRAIDAFRCRLRARSKYRCLSKQSLGAAVSCAAETPGLCFFSPL